MRGIKIIAATLSIMLLSLSALPIVKVEAATPAVARPGRYVALGDSVAAGIGLQAATGADPVCGVSAYTYGAYVAQSTGMTYQNAACSGATAGDLVTKQRIGNTSRYQAAQLDQAFAAGRPSLISITAGANDILWSYYVNKCLTKTCGTTSDVWSSAALLGTLRSKLSYAIRDISTRSHGQPPRVVLTGYYRPFSTACVQQLGGRLTAAELAWINKQTAALNKVISDTAAQYASFARYAPVNFSGHELCTKSPWIQSLTGHKPVHPTYSGQRVISAAVLRQVH